jgi:hypothetical protein
MNADFEAEIGAWPAPYHRTPTIARRNRRLALALLPLAREGDAVLVDAPWPAAARDEAAARGVEIVLPGGDARKRRFTPWGWTPSAIAAGERAGAIVEPVPLDVVARVNSKRFSHEIERDLGIAPSGAMLAGSLEELERAVARACPGRGDKWVVKSLFGFAARERVLGRGPAIDPPSAVWAERRFARGGSLLFEPWLDVGREYGVQLRVRRDASVDLLGITRMVTNGAGATTGYLLGDPPPAERAGELEQVAREVGTRLAAAGYRGPANVDALEHAEGLRPLLEINARHTMGLVALAVERELRPAAPTLWEPARIHEDERDGSGSSS